MTDEFEIPEEIAEWIGLKKSQLLSELILKLGPKDFGFEDFGRFDFLLSGTIENPDKSFQYKEDNFTLRTCVRTYENPEYLHQVVVGLMLDGKNNSQVFIPILIFVSRDKDLVMSFEKGEALSSPLLN